jgi:glutathione S-transferase
VSPTATWSLWGSRLSPYALKLEALLRFCELDYRWLPAEGSRVDALRCARRRSRLVAGRLPLTWPRMDELDEFPLVPFLFGPGGENLYDSTAIAFWLDQRGVGAARRDARLLPEDPTLRFTVRLLDEAFDEVGLYLVHHNRWVMSAGDNDAGTRLAAEMRPLLGPAAAWLSRSFPARQVRRLPYLMSVADPGADHFADLPRRLRPPSHAGFPPTHELLDRAFTELLGAVEPVLSRRPYLFGERFTLADASLYGQLGMNLADPIASARVQRDAPATDAWLRRLATGDFGASADRGAVALDADIEPLLAWVDRTFVPLMRQNQQAYARHQAAGDTLFNESAFDRDRALYDGELLGSPFRSVAKTFQVRVWRDLQVAWRELAASSRERLTGLIPAMDAGRTLG